MVPSSFAYRLVDNELLPTSIRDCATSEYHPNLSPDVGFPTELSTIPHDVLPKSDPWPWGSVDVPGSPQLSRLFEALHIYHPSTMEPLSLSDSQVADYSDHAGFVSGADLSNMSPAKEEQAGTYLRGPSTSIKHLDIASPATLHNNHCGVDLQAPGTFVQSPSPFSELYPFPTSLNQSARKTLTNLSELNVLSLEAQANHLQSYLATFGNNFSTTNPMILRTMETLGEAFFKMGNFIESEVWWTRLIASLTQVEGAQLIRKISAMNQALKSLHWQGNRSADIEALDRQTSQLLTKYSLSEHEVALEYLQEKSTRLSNKRRTSEAEIIRRQILQIRLTHLGPRDLRTIQAMGSLGDVTTRKLLHQKIRESPPGFEVEVLPDSPEASRIIHLTRSAVQLYTSIGSILETDGTILVNRLSFALGIFGRYEEASKLGEQIVKKCIPILGERHPQTLRQLAELGSNYRKQGRFEESVPILRNVLSLQNPGIQNGDISWRLNELGKALQSLGCYEEAAEWFLKVFEIDLQISTASDGDTALNCRELGGCYIQLCQYDRARDFYDTYIKKILMEEGVNETHPVIEQVQGWIEELDLLVVEGDGSKERA